MWTGPAGARARVLAVDAMRVQVTHLESGNRDWLERREFLATWKPPRATVARNPKAKKNPTRKAATPKKGKIPDLLWALGFDALAKDVQSGKTEPIAALEFVSKSRIAKDWQRNTAAAALYVIRNGLRASDWQVAKATIVGSGPKRAKNRIKKNPRGADSTRARKVAEMWHESKPTSARRMKAPKRIPAELAGLGALRSVVYESDKYAGSADNPKGKQQLYKHSFKKPYPWLASDGESLFVVGGKVKVTADGLVN